MKPKIVAIIAACVIAISTPFIVRGFFKSADEPLLEEAFYDHDLKLTYNPPRNWKAAEIAEELQGPRAYRLVSYFEGPNSGDQCHLIVIFDHPYDRLPMVRQTMLLQDREQTKHVLEDSLGELNDMDVWIYEYQTLQSGLLVHRLQVFIDRGDRKVGLFFIGLPKSMDSQRDAIWASIESLTMD